MAKMLKIKISNVFRFLTGDVDYLAYGGKWYRKVADTRYHVIELTNMWEATGDKSVPQYHVSLSEVDISSPQLKVAMDSCGPDDDEPNELVKVDALASYGCKAPLGQWTGGNARKLLSEARSESRSLDDPDAYEAAMSRPVNALGSTAREYAACDIDSAIARGVQRGDANAKIMAKLQGKQSSEQSSADSVMFGKLNPSGQLTNVRNISREDIGKCKFFILSPDHYRDDGSCKCNDREHRAMMIRDWGYTEEHFEGIPLEG
jgi:hypothetical protein